MTAGIVSCTKDVPAPGTGAVVKTLRVDLLRDKIAGGWAGKMIGVTFGAPTEFRARGEIYDKELAWEPSNVTGSLKQDDLYVQMSFMMTMDTYGIDAPAEKFAESFATAGYPLWHAINHPFMACQCPGEEELFRWRHAAEVGQSGVQPSCR